MTETISIAEKCMLVQIRQFGWTASIKDQGITGEVEEAKEAERGTGGYYKQLFQRSKTLDTLRKNRAGLTKYHETVTSPWLGRGMRIMMNRTFEDYRSRVSDYKNTDEDLVRALVAGWEKDIERDKSRLGKSFNETDYPNRDRVAKQFHLQVRFFPVPVADDWRCQLMEQDIEEIKAGIEDEVQEGVAFAMKDTWGRIHMALEHWVEKLTDPEEGKRNRLYNSMTDGMAELAMILPSLNVSDDPQLATMAQELQGKLVRKYKLDDLKEDADLRVEARDEAQKIVDQMVGFGVLQEAA